MKFKRFETIISPERLQRYVVSCNGDKRKTMVLYRKNMQLSQETFAIISCFEIALRNAIDRELISRFVQYNNTYIFNELDKVNMLRNRIAHHEQICFTHHSTGVDTSYIRNEYNKILTLFHWMGIDSRSLLFGLDHVDKVCNQIEAL